MAKKAAPEKASSAGNSNVLAAVSYVIGFITGIIILLVAGGDKYVKFHAMQSIFFSIVTIIISFILGFVPFAGIVWGIIVFIAWVVLIVKAAMGEKFKLHVIGNWAENSAK